MAHHLRQWNSSSSYGCKRGEPSPSSFISPIFQWSCRKFSQISKKFLEKADKSASIQTKISRFQLASYRNTPHTVTGRTPTEILLGRSPRTCLSLVHPCLSDHLTQKAEANVGKKQPRQFTVNQKVLVLDFRPHCSTKWYVLKHLGLLTYEVMMEGKPRSVHVDHL